MQTSHIFGGYPEQDTFSKKGNFLASIKKYFSTKRRVIGLLSIVAGILTLSIGACLSEIHPLRKEFLFNATMLLGFLGTLFILLPKQFSFTEEYYNFNKEDKE